jgi:hypothetical protein
MTSQQFDLSLGSFPPPLAGLSGFFTLNQSREGRTGRARLPHRPPERSTACARSSSRS